jgi:hypothetical protein
MNSPTHIPKNGTKLIVTNLDKETKGFLVKEKHTACRRVGEVVEMMGYVPGAGGDLWWCKHSNGDIAAYGFWEVEFANQKNDGALTVY